MCRIYNKTIQQKAEEAKTTKHRDICNRACIFLYSFLQNTNTSTFLSEGIAVHDLTVTAEVHFIFLLRNIVSKWRQRPAYAANNLLEHFPGGY